MRPERRYWPGNARWDFDQLGGACPLVSANHHPCGADACEVCRDEAWSRYYHAEAQRLRDELRARVDQAPYALERAVRRERPWHLIETEHALPDVGGMRVPRGRRRKGQ